MAYHRGAVAPFTILHISDLHFTAKGRPERVDQKAGPKEAAEAVGGDEGTTFLDRFKSKILSNTSRDFWPNAVIVSGDLVDRGGTDVGGGSSEFGQAVTFLKDLAKVLGINDELVLVVPGNHDVNWSANLQQGARFKNYIDAVSAPFTTPIVDESGKPHLEKYEAKDVPIEVALLVSPTFSGVPDRAPVVARILELLADFPADQREQLESILHDTNERLDIAAIGAFQREQIAKRFPLPGEGTMPIRIAVQHHHLLPDPQLEITQFESVLDSGRVLDSLIAKRFDLVLTGHKHNQRLVQYRHDGRVIDVLTAPSLFEGKNPGFALIDIFGSDDASYARIRTYSTQCDERQVTSLVREGRVLPQVEGLCARIGPEEQKNHLAPVLGDLAKAFEWRRGHFASQLFDEVLAEVGRDVERLADRQLLFRGRALHGKWAELISVACEAGKPEVRLASESDISYWQQAAVEDSDPWKYEEPLRKLSGKKHRILVLRAADLRSEADIETAAAVLQRMTNDGFEVSVVDYAQVGMETEKDFGIIGGVAVSHFDGRGHHSRSLRESLSDAALAKANKDWDLLVQLRGWSKAPGSSDTADTFKQWASTSPLG